MAQIVRIQLQVRTAYGKIQEKHLISITEQPTRRKNDPLWSSGSQRITDRSNQFPRTVSMCTNVLPCDIRKELPVPVRLSVEDDARLCTVPSATESPGAQKQAQFKGHVHAWQPGSRISFRT